MLHPIWQRAHIPRHQPRRLGHHDIPALALQDLIDKQLRHRLGVQVRVHKRVFRRQHIRQMRARETLRDHHGADGRRVVAHLDLGRERLVEREGRRLARAVVDHCRRVDVRRLRGYGHDHPVVVLDHAGQELAGQPVVREGVDFKCQSDIRFGRSEDRLPAQDPRVVHQHRRLAHLRPDLGRGLRDLVGGRDIALEELDVWVRAVFEGLDVEDCDFDAAKGQAHRDALPDPVAAARQDDELFAPVVRVARPVVEGAAVEVVVEPAD